MRSILALLLLLVASLAHAAMVEEPTLDYDRQLDNKQRLIVRLVVRTRVCLGDAARAIMGQGVKETQMVRHFMVSMCGDPLYAQLRRDGMPEEQARRTLVELTTKALYLDVLHQPIPSN